MIYKLDQIYLQEADEMGMHFICMSETGLYFLAQSDSVSKTIEVIEEYQDSDLAELYQNPEWIQPKEPE